MTYQIKSEDMAFVRDISKKVINGLFSKNEEEKVDIKTANAVTGASNNIIRAFGNDLKARMALAGLVESEAKLVEAQKAADPQKLEAQGAGA